MDWPADEQGARNQAVLVDVLRRARCFDEASALIERLLPHPAITDGIDRALRFQTQLISRQDAECHTCEEAFEAVAGRGPSSTRGDRR